MESADVSENVGFGLTQVDKIQTTLIGEIDSDRTVRYEIFNLSHSKISSASVEDGASYFRALEEHYEHNKDDIVKFLCHLTNESNLHLDQGTTSVSFMLKQYMGKRRENELRMKQMGIWQKCELIGREQEIQRTLDKIQSKHYKGVWVCGLGGMGKSSLVNEVCRRLLGEETLWRVIKVELREQKYIRDLVRNVLNLIGESLMTSYREGFSDGVVDEKPEEDFFIDSKEDSQRQQMINKFCENSGENKVLFLDNIDGLLANDETGFTDFLHQVVNKLSEAEEDPCHQGKARILITCRQRLRSIRKTSQLTFEEIHLSGLTEQQAMALFKRELKRQAIISYNEKDLQTMASFCGCCPLAVLSVSGMLKDILPSKLISAFQLCESSVILKDILGVETCLRQSFSVLEERYKIILMKISVFRTAKFDIDAAAFVCGGNADSGKAKMQLDVVILQNRHLLELSSNNLFDLEPSERTTQTHSGKKSHSSKSYYVHPLVHQFLRTQEEHFENIVTDSRARYVEHINRVMSKTAKMSSVDSRNTRVKYQPHFQIFFEYVMQYHLNPRPITKDVTNTTNVLNTEWLLDLILDTTCRCQFYKQMIDDAMEENNVLEILYYKTCLAKLYFDNDRHEKCEIILTEIEDMVDKHEALSKPKDVPSALVLGGYWTMQARYFNRQEKYGEAKEYLLKRALRAFENKGKDCWLQISSIYNLLGVIYHNLKEYEWARQWHEQALNFVNDKPDAFIDKDTFLTNIGTALLKQWEKNKQRDDLLQEAEHYYNRALKLESAKAEKRAKILTRRGKLYLRQKRFDVAERDFQDSLDIWKSIVNPPNINLISSYHDISSLFRKKGTDLTLSGKPGSVDSIVQAYNNYKEIQSQIEQGGLFNWHNNSSLYAQIVKNHKKVLRRLNKDTREIEQVKEFYRGFEAGKFNRKILHRRSFDLDDEHSLRSLQSSSHDEGAESGSESSDSLSRHSETSSIGVTSEEDTVITKNCDAKTEILEGGVQSIDDTDIKSADRERYDSGIGDSNTSYTSSTSDFHTKAPLYEEEVFSPCENRDISDNNSLRKRRHFDRYQTCTLKRQKRFDEYYLCCTCNPNQAF